MIIAVIKNIVVTIFGNINKLCFSDVKQINFTNLIATSHRLFSEKFFYQLLSKD